MVQLVFSVTLGGTVIIANGATVEQLLDSPGAYAEITLPQAVATLNLGAGRQPVTVTMGDTVSSGVVFTGWTEATNKEVQAESPFYQNTLTAWGNSKIVGDSKGQGKTWKKMAGSGGYSADQILEDCMELGGLGTAQYSVNAGSLDLALMTPLVLQDQQSPLTVVDRVLDIANAIRFDALDGVVTVIPWPFDAGTPSADWVAVEGDAGAGTLQIAKIGRPQAISDAITAIKVLGREYPVPKGDPKLPTSDYDVERDVPTLAPHIVNTALSEDYFTRPHSFKALGSAPYRMGQPTDDALIETYALAGTLASKKLKRYGGLPEQQSFSMPGKWQIQVADIMQVTYADVDIASPVVEIVTKVRQEMTAEGGFWTRGAVRGLGAGAGAGTPLEIVPSGSISFNGSEPLGLTPTFAVDNATKGDSTGPFGYDWSIDNSPATLSGIDEREFSPTIIPEGDDAYVPGTFLVQVVCVVTDPKDNIRTKLTRTVSI